MDQSKLLIFILDVLEDLDIPYMITGSVASIIYGEWRMTNDIDIVADIGEEKLGSFISKFPENDFYLSADAAKDAILNHQQFNIIHPESGYKIDIIVLKKSLFSINEFSRRLKIPVIEKREAHFATPEDVILKKMEFYQMGRSEKHLRDIASMIAVSRSELDLFYIGEWAEKLGLDKIWDDILKKLLP